GVRPGHKDILPAHPSRASQLRCHLFVQQTLPSFLRISKVLREATETYGFGVVPGGATLYAYD
ncbi:hypothetical protein, partial [Mycobacteroides abscessus]|uniref:hypothetical protein n=1 Tax=Mycobacteroides abscessus TaxID=36809 RepID=UPI001A978333